MTKKTDAETTLWQSNFITSARYEMSALEKNLIYMIMSQMKKSDKDDTIYTVSGKELMDSTGKEIDYADLKKASGKLITRMLDGMDNNGNYVQTAFISSATYLTGKGMIEISLSPAIRPHFIELKEKFTTFQLDVALCLNSIYSKRLYEILSMYKNYPEKSFGISVTDLKEKLGLVSPIKGDKYENFSHFKRAVLDPAEREINGESDLFFSFKTVEGKKSGKGRKPVEYLTFSIIHKGKDDPKVGYEEDIKPAYERLINEFGLRKDQATEIVNNYSKKDIFKMLYDIHVAKMNNKISNLGAYTAKVFNVK